MSCISPCNTKERENSKYLKTTSESQYIKDKAYNNIFNKNSDGNFNNPEVIKRSERREKEKQENENHSTVITDEQKEKHDKRKTDLEPKNPRENENHSIVYIDAQKEKQDKNKRKAYIEPKNPKENIGYSKEIKYDQKGKLDKNKRKKDLEPKKPKEHEDFKEMEDNQRGKQDKDKNKNDLEYKHTKEYEDYTSAISDAQRKKQDKENKLNKLSEKTQNLKEEEEYSDEGEDYDEDREEINRQYEDKYYSNKYSNYYDKTEFDSDIYCFKNTGNNCYLNSSLQLLTRVDGLRTEVLKFDKINTDCITKGKLIREFKKILNDIENKKNYRAIYPNYLKAVMGRVDERYYNSKQEDANEFISNFLNALLDETADKSEFKEKKTSNFDNEVEKAYIKFYNKYYKRKGKSFLLDLFYGNLITKKYCKNCHNILSIKFNAFNMLELPIYELSKSKKYFSSLNIDEILDSYFSESKIYEDSCENCNEEEIYSRTYIYKLPENLIIYFGRSANEEYINDKIDYDKNIKLHKYLYDKEVKNKNYYLDCVIEHSGNSDFGHYTALCQIKQGIWYFFSDTFCHKNSSGFNSENAIILLYKS